MEVTMYIVKKRKNSTFRPSGEGFTTSVTLKQDVSVLRPVFLLGIQFPGISRPKENYLVWGERYYFITDMIYKTKSVMEIYCEVDVLATYKDEILERPVFIARAEDSFNSMLYDQYIPMQANYEWTATRSAALEDYSGEGSYIIRTIGKSRVTSSMGVTGYAVNRNTLKEVLDFLFTDGNYDFLADAVVKSFFNPFQYIVSIDWFPFHPNYFCQDGASPFEEIMLGWWSTGIKAHVVNKDSLTPFLNVSFPPGRYGDFRDSSEQWTETRCFVPGCGMFFLNPADVQNGLDFKYSIDVATGQTLVNVYQAGEQYMIANFSGQMSTTVSIGQLQSDLQKPVTGVIDGISSFLSNPFKGVADLLGTTADIAMESNKPTPNFNGSAGNVGAITNIHNIYLLRKQYYAADYPNAQLGRPLCKHDLLSNHTGYAQCLAASLSITSAMSEEIDLINRYLNGGVYLE